MTGYKPRSYSLLTILVATAAPGIFASRAHAMGFGWGIGFNYVAQPSDLINQHSLLRGGRAKRPESNNVYAGNPNAYINKLRDNGFISHTSLSTRPSIARRRPPSQSPAKVEQASSSAPVAPARPVDPIGSFFNSARMLVWPGDAPIDGDLKEKRDSSDEASLAVADLVDQHRSAPITTVTHARQRLLDYGQPALGLIRSRTTPRVSESFHDFLMSLYSSLGRAAEPAP